MREHIYLKNFGPIKELDLDIKPLLIFIGESGTGKSAILKILSLLRWVHKQNNLRSFFKKSGIAKKGDYSRLRSERLLIYSGLDEFVTKNTEIIFEVDGTKYEKKGKLPTDARINELSLEKVSFINENRGVLPDIVSNKIPRGVNLPYYLEDTYNMFYKAFTELNKVFHIESTDIDVFEKKGKLSSSFYIKDTDENYQMKLENASSGTKTSVFVEVITHYLTRHFNFGDILDGAFTDFLIQKVQESYKGLREVNKVIDSFPNFKNNRLSIFIEEPELSLFPTAQIRLINRLIKDCFVQNNRNIRLAFATHSPYIVNHLNLLMKAFDTNNTDFTNGAKMNGDDIDVLLLEKKGLVSSLKAQNTNFIDTNTLSEDINKIYESYRSL